MYEIGKYQKIYIASLLFFLLTFFVQSSNNNSQTNVQIYDVPLNKLSKPIDLSIQTGFKTYIEIQQMFPEIQNNLISSSNNTSNSQYKDNHIFSNIQSFSISLQNYPSSLTNNNNKQNNSNSINSQNSQNQCTIQSPEIQFINMSSLILQQIKSRPRIITNYKDILNEETLIDVHYFNKSMFLAATNNNFFLVKIVQQKNDKNKQKTMKALASLQILAQNNSVLNGIFISNSSQNAQIQSEQQKLLYFFSNEINCQISIQIQEGVHKILLINQDLLPLPRQNMVDAIYSKQNLFILTSKQVLVYHQNQQSKHFNILEQIILCQIFENLSQNSTQKTLAPSPQLVAIQYVKQSEHIIVLDENLGLFIIFLKQPSKNLHIPLYHCTDMTLILSEQNSNSNKQTIFTSCQNTIIKISLDSNDLAYTIQKHKKQNIPFFITQIEFIIKNLLLLKSNEDFHFLYQNNILGLNDNTKISNPFHIKKNSQNILVWLEQKTLNLQRFLIKNEKVMCNFNRADQKTLYVEVVADCNQQYLKNVIVPSSIGQNVTSIIQNNNYCRYKSKIQLNIWQKTELEEWLIPTLTVIVAVVILGGIILFFQIRKINFYRNTKQFGIQFQDQN